MNKERLIEEVRKYPFLYDTNDPKYNDLIKKDNAWKAIANTLCKSVIDCRKNWQNLREYQRRAIKRKNTGVGPNRKWLYEDEMAFLLPHYRERPFVNPSGDEYYDGCFDYREENEPSVNVDETRNSPFQSPSNMGNPNHSQFSSFMDQSSNNTCKKKKKNFMSASAQLMNYILEEKANQPAEDEIDKFFSSMAATVKKCSPYNQALLKTKIFQLVSEAEMQELTYQRVNTPKPE